MFDEKRKPWIVELNSMPGMYFEPGQEKTRKYFYKELLKVFKRELSI
jgi:D-alanine-D-alanine ligase-like ATP-grasp enzyme